MRPPVPQVSLSPYFASAAADITGSDPRLHSTLLHLRLHPINLFNATQSYQQPEHKEGKRGRKVGGEAVDDTNLHLHALALGLDFLDLPIDSFSIKPPPLLAAEIGGGG